MDQALLAIPTFCRRNGSLRDALSEVACKSPTTQYDNYISVPDPPLDHTARNRQQGWVPHRVGLSTEIAKTVPWYEQSPAGATIEGPVPQSQYHSFIIDSHCHYRSEHPAPLGIAHELGGEYGLSGRPRGHRIHLSGLRPALESEVLPSPQEQDDDPNDAKPSEDNWAPRL